MQGGRKSGRLGLSWSAPSHSVGGPELARRGDIERTSAARTRVFYGTPAQDTIEGGKLECPLLVLGFVILSEFEKRHSQTLILRRALEPAGQEGEEGPVFRPRDGAAWGDARTAFEHASRRAKITDFRFHDPRHTCASWLVMRGRSLKEVQEILGYREFSMTLRHAHLSPDRLREAVAARGCRTWPLPASRCRTRRGRTQAPPAAQAEVPAERVFTSATGTLHAGPCRLRGR